MAGTVIDDRGITLSAGVAAFDKVLVERFKDFTAKTPAGPDVHAGATNGSVPMSR
jgi:hypothetical protein